MRERDEALAAAKAHAIDAAAHLQHLTEARALLREVRPIVAELARQEPLRLMGGEIDRERWAPVLARLDAFLQ
jgi:hypothetical protein